MRQVSVLFINMVLPKKGDQSAWAQQKAFEIIYDNVKRLRGNLNKVFSFDKGCTFLVVFGLPGDKHEDDPTRALMAGHRIIDALHTVLEITHEAIGVTTGRAFCGVVGHRDRHEYTVIGRRVNMAARLMVNYPGILSCDNETFTAAKSKLKKDDFLLLPAKPLKGIAEPGPVREYNRNHDREIEDNETEYPILGRERECEEMRTFLHTVKCDDTSLAGNRRLVIVEGEGGIGKTRLLEEFMDVAEEEEFRVDYVEADMAHAHTPYYVVQMLITILLELEPTRTPAEREHVIKDHITNTALLEDISLLNDLLGTHFAPHIKFAHMLSAKVTEHFHRLLFGIVHQIAVEQPCLFAVDNGQFIDHESWEFLEDLQQDSHAVVLLALRPFSSANPPCEAAVRMINHQKTKKFQLKGIDSSHMTDLAFQFMEVTYIPNALHKILTEKSHGVASWCEQLIKDMLASRIIDIVDEDKAFASHESASFVSDYRQLPPIETRPQTSVFLADKPDARPGTPTGKSRRRSLFGRVLDARPSETRRHSIPTVLLGDSPSLVASDTESLRSSIVSELEGMISLPQEIEIAPMNYNFERKDFVKASSGVMPKDTHKACIVRPDVDITKVLVPESVKDMVLARVDRMSPEEQITLKCVSILGSVFSRDLIVAVVPKSGGKMKIDLVLYNLARENILECASLAAHHQLAHNHHGFYDYNDPAHAQQHGNHHHHHHHHNVATSLHAPVLCGCYADEGNKILNLSRMMTPSGPKKHCMYFKFINNYVQETTYAVWLEDQRKQLHERAAMFLESQAHKCKACGGGGFIPGGLTPEESPQAEPNVEANNQHRASGTARRSNSILSSSKRRKTTEMRENVKSQGGFSSRAHERSSIIDSSALAKFAESTRENLAVSNDAWIETDKEPQKTKRGIVKTSSSATASDGVANAIVSSSGYVLNTVLGQAVDDRRESLIQRLKMKLRAVRNMSDATKELTEAQIRNTLESAAETTKRLIRSEGEEKFADMTEFETVDLQNCKCAEILASIFPQLVQHWRAANNKIKTMRYLTESGAASLATSANMQALSYLYEVREIFAETKKDENTATKEEMARVENLIGQALFHMNRLDEALPHFIESLHLLGKRQPTSTFGVYLRIRRESIRHKLHVLFPGYFIGGAGECSQRFIEQARCLGHLSHLYHALHKNDRSLMAALQGLNAAEEAEENLHELLVAYAAVIECTHLVGWTDWGVFYETVGLEKCKDPRLYLNAEDLVTVGHLYYVSLSFRLSIGNIEGAIKSAQLALTISNRVNDVHMKIACLPLYVQAHILSGKLDDCHELLKELNYTSIEEEDSHGRALYMCCSLDMMLEGGQRFEQIDRISQFTVKASTDPAFSGDTVPKLYLNASFALWHARREEWDLADKYILAALMFNQDTCEAFMSVHGLVKIIECQLLQLRATPKNRTLRHDMKKELKKLKKACHQFPVLHPRCTHLRAYHALLSGKTSKSRSLLRSCIAEARSMGLLLEVEWAGSHLAYWYRKSHEDLEKYDGTIKYLLPPAKSTADEIIALAENIVRVM
ncbi:adenylate cyclase type 10-like isoform X2 [Nematostella vectensis]|nr:adenylate cyclase type 10-like isoform X2 [Nematostella vectensis]